MMRFWRLLGITLLLLLLVWPGLAEESANLLVNGDFESLNGQGLPSGWYTDAYVHQEGYSAWSVSEDARTGDYSAVVSNFGDNDARFAQRVEVEPDSLYCFSGYVKVLDMTDYGRGANLSIDGVFVFSESLYEATDNWVYLELYGQTGPDQREVIVFARVGGYSGESIGSAQFDDLSLRKIEVVPGNGTASKWYKETAQQSASGAEEEEKVASPFWPWLLAISALYLIAGMWMVGHLQRDPRELTEQKRPPLFFLIGLGVAAVARLIVAWRVSGYQVDVNCFISWGSTMANVGPSMFYQTTSFCDYAPAYLYMLGINGAVANLFGSAVPAYFVHKLVPMACDLAMAYLLYRIACKKLDQKQAGLLGLLFAINPAMALNSAGWCQIDSVLCLSLMLVAWLALERKWAAVLPVYVLSALIKPQALMLGPLGLMAIVLEQVKEHKAAGKKPSVQTLKPLLVGLGLSAAVAAVVVIPFCFHQKSGTWLIDLYSKTLASYPHATVNAANIYYLLDGNWRAIELLCGKAAPIVFALLAAAVCVYLGIRQRKMPLGWLEPVCMAQFFSMFGIMIFLDTSWQVLGTVAMVMCFVIVLACYFRSGKLENLPLCGAVLFILLFVLGIKMHERYLFPALILLAMAYALRRDVRILVLLVVTSCTMLVNEGIVLDNCLRLGATSGHLNSDTLALNDLTSLVNVIMALLAIHTCHDVCVCDKERRLKLPYTEKAREKSGWKADPKLYWTRLDWILMLSVTLVYSVVTLTTLGSTKAPQNPWKSTAYEETVTIDLGQHYDDVSMLYFCQVSYNDFSVAVSEDGESWSDEYWAEMKQGQCFRWKYLAPSTEEDGVRSYSDVKNTDDAQRLSGRYVRITAQQIGLFLNEVIFRDAAGERIPATVLRAEHANESSPNYSDPTALLDEQNTLKGEPSWWNGTYFDEIYHARTAFEHHNGTAPYETTHPPLGKVIMSWGVGIFGMTPFGWRFAGALTGILMLPAMYVIGKQLTKRTSIGFAAMTMMVLDCMHFTQTRIATIDSFPVLFIILSWLFMLRFMQRDIIAEPVKAVLPDLALSGFFMGCGIASKWIGIYSGVGLAVMYFWTCMRHVNRQEKRRWKEAIRRVVTLCLWCLLFFVAVPLTIYLLSYVPYFAYAYKENLWDFLRKVYDANIGMFNYHATPGLGMDHPFYSPWYEWPLIKRPMYYASPNFVPEGWSYALFCFGNPAVWLVGLAGIAVTAFVWAKGHCYELKGSDMSVHLYNRSWSVAPAFVLVGLLAQFLPWMLVPRGTYIYHYFASVPFLILGTVLVLHWLQERFPNVGHAVMVTYLVVCLVFFVAYFPYASGLLTPTWWLDFMKKFLRVYY